MTRGDAVRRFQKLADGVVFRVASPQRLSVLHDLGAVNDQLADEVEQAVQARDFHANCLRLRGLRRGRVRLGFRHRTRQDITRRDFRRDGFSRQNFHSGGGGFRRGCLPSRDRNRVQLGNGGEGRFDIGGRTLGRQQQRERLPELLCVQRVLAGPGRQHGAGLLQSRQHHVNAHGLHQAVFAQRHLHAEQLQAGGAGIGHACFLKLGQR